VKQSFKKRGNRIKRV